MTLRAFLLFLFLSIQFFKGETCAQDLAMTKDAIERGKALFVAQCNLCHGLKYYKDKEHPQGYAPLMDEKAAEGAFGTVPPDLSLMASARGKGTEGAQYIRSLLLAYYTDPQGKVKNRAFAAATGGDGTIAMPPPIPLDDPQLNEKASEIGSFLYHVSEPSLEDRTTLGPYVIGFMIVLTALLYTLNGLVWARVKGRH